MLIAFVSTSQTSADTVCLPLEQAKAAINIIEKGKVVQQELALTRKSLTVAEDRIKVKDSTIKQFLIKEAAYLGAVNNLKATIANNDKIIENLEKTITLERKNARGKNVWKWIALAASIAFVLK